MYTHPQMRTIHSLESFTAPPAGTVLTIGNFDGLHPGHRRLIDTARQLAQGILARGALPAAAPATASAATPAAASTDEPAERPECVVVTFEPSPLTVLAPQRAPPRLTTLPEKAALIERAGADALLVLRGEPALLALTADEFLGRLLHHCRPRAIVEGASFHFGRGRGGNIETLKSYGARHGFSVQVVEEWLCAELPGRPAISSSAVRSALADGDVSRAAMLLGRPHRVTGTVGRGQGRGAPLGFPTANLHDVPQMLPAEAVYTCVAQLEDGSLHLAAVNFGPQPTFDQPAARVEAHLLDFHGDLHGQRVGLHLAARLRGQQKFAGIAALREQLARDVEATRAHAVMREAIRTARPIPL